MRDGGEDGVDPGEGGIRRPERLEPFIVGVPGGEVGLGDDIGPLATEAVDAAHVVEAAWVSTMARTAREINGVEHRRRKGPSSPYRC